MAIPTSRCAEPAEIRINTELCNGCGLCVAVCKDFGLKLDKNKVVKTDNPVFGCIGCGHCMAVCPKNAIEIFGREISPADLFEMPLKENASNYDQLMSLYQRRRSVREFINKEVEPELVEKIINAARTAPMGLPPSDVNVLVLDSTEKGHQFVSDFCNFLRSMKWFVSGWFLFLMKPFWGKANDEMFRNFVKPMFDVYTNRFEAGENVVNYDAPLTLYFYGSPYSDPADPIVAATAAMYAGEALGLGTCMLGAMHPMIQYGYKARKFREKYHIKYKSREGLFLIFGYPKMKYVKGINRTFASETYYEQN